MCHPRKRTIFQRKRASAVLAQHDLVDTLQTLLARRHSQRGGQILAARVRAPPDRCVDVLHASQCLLIQRVIRVTQVVQPHGFVVRLLLNGLLECVQRSRTDLAVDYQLMIALECFDGCSGMGAEAAIGLE